MSRIAGLTHVKRLATPFLSENKRLIAQSILTIFFFAVGIWFIQHERAEISNIRDVLVSAGWRWVLAGLILTVIHIFLQGVMYVFSFATVSSRVSLVAATTLFVKRNFISVFLPAGGVSSLAFFTGAIENRGIKKSQIHFASSVYAFVGILSVVIVAIPSLFYALFEGVAGAGEWYAIGAIVLLLTGLVAIYLSITRRGLIYRRVVKYFPSSEVFLSDLQSNRIDKKKLAFTIIASIFIEFTGIAHLYIAMVALHYQPSLFAAVMGYIISVIFLVVSPFLRGLGAVEVSMAYILTRFGFGHVEAIAVTFLYRFFEFWTPLLAGLLTFLSKINRLLMRILPALLLLLLGIVNIISVLTPAVKERIALLRDFLPVEAIHASNYLVMVAGLYMLVTAAFLLKGLKNAWWFALILTLVSFVGHITKAIDYEEAGITLFVLIILLVTHKEYYIKSNPRLRNVGIQTSLLLALATLIYGIAGFYFLDKKHFDIDFSFPQSIRYTLQNFFLIGSDDLIPYGSFARHFLFSIKCSGFISIAFLIYTLVRLYKHKKNISDEDYQDARNLLQTHGNSALDYFKIYTDKLIFFSDNRRAFVSYRNSGSFAVALENPVAENSLEMSNCINQFDKYCYENGLKSIFYRVPEESLGVYANLRKKSLFVGQEGVVDLRKFTLEGGSRKSLRNALNKVSERGYKASVHIPPVKDGILQKIKAVSDEWLADTNRSEIVFSQGMFVWEELKQQTIVTVENSEEKIIAFLNIVPDSNAGEATYDLMRKTKDAPNGVMDFIMVELFKHLKSQGIDFVNIGLAPMSGLDDPHKFTEKSLKFAYERIKAFSHYKGMREYKAKFEPVWFNKYLIYQDDYDLLKIPAALSKVIKP
jgi:phosphatidylglycerol lysyltransferase